ncbi:MAG: DUF3108 domain-containing protein [Oligoflexia bacterium]|nr:DUF3108 domain-containing protein [Oligoflexia bacterium]
MKLFSRSIWITIAILLLFSCAGNNKTRIPADQIPKKDLLEEFSVGDDYLKKFKEQQTQATQATQAIQVTPVTQSTHMPVPVLPATTNIKSQKLTKPKDNKRTLTKVKTVKAKEVTKEEIKEVNKFKEVKEVKKVKEVTNTVDNNYPEKYPDLYKEYDRNSISVWQKFSPRVFIGEVIEIAVKYFGITCGSVTMKTLPTVRIGQREAFHLHALAKSAEFYESFYAIDDYVETFVDAKNFTPIKYTLIQRESKQSIDDLQLFDMEKLKTLYWFKREKNGETSKEEKNEFIPKLLQDSFAVLYFMRGLPLKIGDVYNIPIVTRAEIWILKATVAEEEELNIKGVKYKALKINAETHFPGVLKKRGDIYFWYSNDDLRIPLKFMAKVKIGKVEGELVKYNNNNLKKHE